MLRMLILVVLVATPALALDQADLDAYQGVRMMCRQGEDQNGPITQEAANKACDELNALGESFKEQGYCWDNGEQTWRSCGLMN